MAESDIVINICTKTVSVTIYVAVLNHLTT